MLFKKQKQEKQAAAPAEPQERYGFAIRINRRLTEEEKRQLSSDEINYMGGNHTFVALIDYKNGIVNEYGYGTPFVSATYSLLPTKGDKHSAQYRLKDGLDKRFADEIHYDISKEEYTALKADLSSKNPESSYHLLAHNCTSWSIAHANAHGLEVPKAKAPVPSPNGLAKALKRAAEEGAHAVSDSAESPSPRKSHVQTLNERLKQSGRSR